MTKLSKAEAIKRGLVYINKTRTIPEVFDVIAKASSAEERVALLRAYDTKALRYVINGFYNVDWSGVQIPTFKFSTYPVGICTMSISTAIGRLEQAYSYRVTNPSVTERNLIIVLEEVSKEEAELLVAMITGDHTYELLPSKAECKEAFPEMFRFQNEPEQIHLKF